VNAVALRDQLARAAAEAARAADAPPVQEGVAAVEDAALDEWARREREGELSFLNFVRLAAAMRATSATAAEP
jgi:hypothetical protein